MKRSKSSSNNQQPAKNFPSKHACERKLIPEKILGATECNGELMFLLQWQGVDEADLVPARQANVHCPQVVLRFYEENLICLSHHPEREKEKKMTSEIYNCTLPEASRQHSVQCLRENEETRNEYILQILEWIKTQPHLHARTDPLNVVRFLRGCKFDLEKTKRKMTNFYELRARCPEWFSNRDPCLPEIQELLKLGVFLPLRQRDEQGRLVVLVRVAVHNPKKHKQSDVFKVGKMTLELALEDDESISVFGVAAVFDLCGVTLGHALQLPPNVVKKAVHAWQDCYPVRTRSLDFVNAPSYVNVVLNIFRRFMTEKLRKRVHVHGRSQSSLHNIVAPELLPKEYGGTNGTLQDLIDYWHNHVTEKRAWFLKDEKHKADL